MTFLVTKIPFLIGKKEQKIKNRDFDPNSTLNYLQRLSPLYVYFDVVIISL